MGRILVIRLAAAAILIISGVVVLGISAHVETSVRALDVSTALYTFGAFIGALTLVVEFALAATRFWFPDSKPAYLVSEVAANTLLWIFWLSAAIAITHDHKDAKSICRNINALDTVPELQGFDPELLRLIKKAMKSACREFNACIVFLWIGVATTTLLMVYYLFLGTSKQKRVGRVAWFQSLPRYDQPTSDPFADPAGNAREFGVGVVSEDPDTK